MTLRYLIISEQEELLMSDLEDEDSKDHARLNK